MSRKTAEILIKHAGNRLMSRFELRYTQHLREYLLHRVKTQTCEVFWKQSNRVTIFDIDYVVKKGEYMGGPVQIGEKVVIRAVYDKQRHTFSTFLTTDMDPRNIHLKEEQPVLT